MEQKTASRNTETKGKVLFLYPNAEGYGGTPNCLALLSACLKQAGFETKCFDTTFLKSPPKSHVTRQKHGGAPAIDYHDVWGEWDPELAKKIPEFFLSTVQEFKPDLIAVTLVDVDYTYAMSLLNFLRLHTKIPVVAGGITATVCPEMVLRNTGVDFVCVGEGEDALVELATALVEKKDVKNIRNLWVKKNSEIIKNPLRPLKNLDELPFQDWSIFDKRHFYKAYCGKFYRTGYFELARGCHFSCTYCSMSCLRQLYKGLGSFVRTRSVDKAIDEMEYILKKYNLELVFFLDENFLGMPPERFNYFCEQYKQRVRLPFYIQTRSETIREDYVKKLKEIGVSTIGIGIEHSDLEFRKKYMNRFMTNEQLTAAFEIIHKYDIRSTANLIIGMPHEEERMMKKTIALLREIKPRSISLNFFQPFQGTKMREMAVEQGLIPADHITSDSNTCLNIPKFPRERIMHYYENFKKYVDGALELDDSIQC